MAVRDVKRVSGLGWAKLIAYATNGVDVVAHVPDISEFLA